MLNNFLTVVDVQYVYKCRMLPERIASTLIRDLSSHNTDSMLHKFEQQIAPLGAIACWNLGLWGKMEEYVHIVDQENIDGAFLRAVLSVRNDDTISALNWIDKCR